MFHERGCDPLDHMLQTQAALEAAALQVSGRPRCKFGSNCYRKNRKHWVEQCHPGDLDWDGTLDGGSPNYMRQWLADVAAWLMESMDQTVNEQYLWCSTTTDIVDRIRETGLEHLFVAPEDTGCDTALVHLFDATSTCMGHAKVESESRPTSPSRNQVLLLCRVLCGSIQSANSSDIAAEVEHIGSNDSIMSELPDGSHRFTVFSHGQIYPEYICY